MFKWILGFLAGVAFLMGANAHAACTYTYQFSSGTTTVASQVNQDLNDIVNCALPASSGTLTGGTLAGTTTLPGSGVITSTGIVGIGTSSPGAPLAILGPSGSPATSGTVQNGLMRIQGGGGNGLDIGNYASGPFGVWMQSGFVLNYSSGAYYPIILNPLGGNVGIGGITSPCFRSILPAGPRSLPRIMAARRGMERSFPKERPEEARAVIRLRSR
jgi:hypothetical protein